MSTPAVAATPITFVCPECGTIKKSAKMSCCAPGGSWFGNCGSAGHTKVGHTWYEGVRACKDRQFQAVVGQQSHFSQPKRNISANDDARMSMNSTVVAVAAHMFTFTPPISDPTTSITVAGNASIISPGRTSIAHDAGTIIFKLITTTARTSANMPVPESTLRLIDGTIPTPVNPTIKSMRSPLTDISMTTSSHTSASTSITAQECEKSLLTEIGRASCRERV